jgi:hypothetical protein
MRGPNRSSSEFPGMIALDQCDTGNVRIDPRERREIGGSGPRVHITTLGRVSAGGQFLRNLALFELLERILEKARQPSAVEVGQEVHDRVQGQLLNGDRLFPGFFGEGVPRRVV